MSDSINHQLDNVYINIFKDINEISDKASHLFKHIHKKSSSRIYIVPGGSTPLLFYRNLANRIDDWSNTTFILSDERIVSKYNKLSNSYHFRKNFLNQIKSNSISRLLFGEFYDGKGPIKNIQLQIINKIRELNKPDIAILGLGEDGHTASLFPGKPDLFSQKKILTIVNRNQEKFSRVSLTFDYLMKAKRLLFLICGQSKAKALRECLYGQNNHLDYPANYIINNYKKRIDIYCDKAAASELHQNSQ